MSFKLLGIPQNKKSAVTRKTGNMIPGANMGGCSGLGFAFLVGIDESPI